MRNKFNKIHYYIFSISLIYFVLFTAFYLVCFLDKDGLYKLIMKYETYNYLPFKLINDDLKNLCSELMKYISGKIPFLETKVTIDNALTEFYSVRSKIHMADVRHLIIVFRNICFASIAVCIFSIFKLMNVKDAIQNLKKAYVKTLVILVSILAILIIIASLDFSSFFVKFHEVLFTNDLWLLNPSEDYIICLLPEKLFMTYAIRIVIAMIIALILPYLCLLLLSKIQPHQEAK